MPLPFILAGAALISAGYGVKKTVDAKNDNDDAKRYMRWAKEEASECDANVAKQEKATNSSLESYGSSKKHGIENINLFSSFFCYPSEETDDKNQDTQKSQEEQLRVAKKFATNHSKITISREEEAKILKDLNIIDRSLTDEQVRDKIKTDNIGLNTLGSAIESITGGSLAGLAAAGGAYLGVGSLASASTGTAIAGLSGAAAKSATLAWLGGGSLASGGLGVAGGTAVLGGLVAGPLLAVGGVLMAAKAAETKDKAYEELSRVRGEIKKREVIISKLAAIEKYTRECHSTFDSLNHDFEHDLLVKIKKLAQRSITFKELNDFERKIVYAGYALKYTLYDFIIEPTMNEKGDGVLEPSKRKALEKSRNLKHTHLK